ncbi:hypothetical protein CMI48_01755 [Candidatus Pacearchaeota archaeon]|nr:hypothetical protein [Candidatus Pacearchaeota archaeon]|tara:strand:+ start:267 stop:881 length:615 start_codon:yes stop_codon:yes gene_type:complete
MRAVGTEAQLDRSRKRNGIIISVLMLVLLVASSVGFAFLSSNHTSGSQQVAGSEGAYEGSGVGGWVVPVLGREVRLTFGLEEVAEIPVALTTGIEAYQGKTLYLAVENPGIEAELRSTIGVFTDRIQLACYGECELDLPEKDCSENVIVWTDGVAEASSAGPRSSDKVNAASDVGGQVTQGEGCVFIEGDLRAVDAFLYKVFGY